MGKRVPEQNDYWDFDERPHFSPTSSVLDMTSPSSFWTSARGTHITPALSSVQRLWPGSSTMHRNPWLTNAGVSSLPMKRVSH
jgi:hypothetical protein